MLRRAREAQELSMTWFANHSFSGQDSSTSSSFGSFLHWKRKIRPWTGLRASDMVCKRLCLLYFHEGFHVKGINFMDLGIVNTNVPEQLVEDGLVWQLAKHSCESWARGYRLGLDGAPSCPLVCGSCMAQEETLALCRGPGRPRRRRRRVQSHCCHPRHGLSLLPWRAIRWICLSGSRVVPRGPWGSVAMLRTGYVNIHLLIYLHERGLP
jgi:hypothetical protein